MEAGAIVERERRWGRPVAAAGLLAVGIQIVSILLSRGSSLGSKSDATNLRTFDAHETKLLVLAILAIVSFTLLAVPLTALFRAAQARTPTMSSRLMGLAIAGPLFLAANGIVNWIALERVSDRFLASGHEVERVADRLIEDSVARQVGQGLLLAGLLGLAAILLYSSLQAMRVGLLTRFAGTLGMALGVSVLLLGLLPAAFVYIAFVSLLFAGLWPGVRPPAWETGEAIPWPAPGEGRARFEDPGSPDGEEPGAPEDRPMGGAPKRKRKRRR